MSDNDLIRRGDAIFAVEATAVMPHDDCWSRAVDAIAALPTVTVGVRPLVWVDFDKLGNYRAETPFGPEGFDRMTYSNGDFAGYMIWSDDVDQVLHPTVEAAKAAAQADYNERILAALEPQPAPDIERLIKEAEWRGQIKAGGVFVNYGTNEADYAEAVQNACPYCNGSGHKDDVTPALDAQAIREAAQGLAAFLDAKHQSYVAANGRNPADYVSGYSIARDKANAILDLIGPKGGA